MLLDSCTSLSQVVCTGCWTKAACSGRIWRALTRPDLSPHWWRRTAQRMEPHPLWFCLDPSYTLLSKTKKTNNFIVWHSFKRELKIEAIKIIIQQSRNKEMQRFGSQALHLFQAGDLWYDRAQMSCIHKQVRDTSRWGPEWRKENKRKQKRRRKTKTKDKEQKW